MTDVLGGRTVLVTRPGGHGGELSELLRARGAVPLEAPTIRLEVAPAGPLDEAVRAAAAGAFDWVVFTSASGVDAWLRRAEAVGAGPSAARVAAVGSATADALGGAGIAPDLVPEPFTTEALGEAFPEGSGRVLLIRADIATADLEHTLRRKGWTPVRVDAYRTRVEDALPDDAARAIEEGRVDAVTFTSRSTVEGFVRLAGSPRSAVVVCIGPVTADAARRAGFRVDAVAEPHTLEGLVEALARAFDGRRGER